MKTKKKHLQWKKNKIIHAYGVKAIERKSDLVYGKEVTDRYYTFKLSAGELKYNLECMVTEYTMEDNTCKYAIFAKNKEECDHICEKKLLGKAVSIKKVYSRSVHYGMSKTTVKCEFAPLSLVHIINAFKKSGINLYISTVPQEKTDQVEVHGQ